MTSVTQNAKLEGVQIGLVTNGGLTDTFEETVERVGCHGGAELDQDTKDETFIDGGLQGELSFIRFNSICRFCLVEGDEFLDIFDAANGALEMIAEVSPVQISLEDVLPKRICTECYAQLKKCISFKQQIESSDATLKEAIKQHAAKYSEHIAGNLDVTSQTKEHNNQSILDYGSQQGLQNVSNLDELIEEDYETGYMMVYETDPILYSDCEKGAEQVDVPIVTFAVEANLGQEVNPVVSEQNAEQNPKEQSSATPAQCSTCDKQFASRALLNKHMKVHLNRKLDHECPVCHKAFPHAANLECHMISHRSENVDNAESEGKIKCNECEAAFSVERDLYIHGSVHVTGDKLQCRECLKEFSNLPKLRRHVKTHYQDKPIKCEQCGRGFPEMASLTRHYRIHTNEPRVRKYACDQCGKSYYDSHSLSIHVRTHTGEKPWVCTKCDKRFIDSRLLNSHMRTHMNVRKHSCTICEKKFTHRSTLISHVRTHTGEKPFVCTVCNKSFIQSSNLMLHLRVHSGEKPYKCSKCSKAFGSSSTLAMHMRTHTGEKPYCCKLCGKRFARHNLTIHMRIHTGEKPYECSDCPRKFTTSGQLAQHKRFHTGDKPFTCEICNKRWSTSSYLKKHMQTHSMNAGTSYPPRVESPDSTVLEKDNHFNHHSHRIRIEEIQSDAEFNENAMLVNDLLASVVNVNAEVLQNGNVEIPELSTNDSDQDLNELRNVMNPAEFKMEEPKAAEMVSEGVYVTEA